MTGGDKTIEIQLKVTHHDEGFSDCHRTTLEWSRNSGQANYQWCLGVHLSDAVLKIVGKAHMKDVIRCMQDCDEEAT